MQPGAIIANRYRVEGLLGEGGMGTVLRAAELTTERPVALKLMAPALAEDAELVARFQREAKLLAKLEHPNLAQLLSVDSHEGVPLLVMKLVHGRTLSKLLAERGRLARGQALPVLDQLCSALDYLHARGVVHRDLKPGNVMVDDDGRVTVLDFGVSHHLGASRLTTPGAFVGTPNYMAPEQITSDEVNPAADIYALALLTWQMLVGEHPFGGGKSGVNEMLEKQVSAMPALASRANPAVPTPVAAVLDRSLDKSPSVRHRTARAFYEDVVKAFGQDSTESEPPEKKTAGPVPQVRPVGVVHDPNRETLVLAPQAQVAEKGPSPRFAGRGRAIVLGTLVLLGILLLWGLLR